MSCTECWRTEYTATLVVLFVLTVAVHLKSALIASEIRHVDGRTELESISLAGTSKRMDFILQKLRTFKENGSVLSLPMSSKRQKVRPDDDGAKLTSSKKVHSARSFKQSAGQQMSRAFTSATLPIGRMFSTSEAHKVVRESDWVIQPREIKCGERLAGGSFGEVFLGEYMGSVVAIKKPNKDIPQDMYEKFVIEVELMVGLHHPNIVRFIGACLSLGDSFLVLEYLEKGCLYDFLRTDECKEYLTYVKMLKFAADIARGMRYLHSRVNIIQRDLKSRNLLLDYAYNVKICDFGLSRYSVNNEQMTACGTPYWAAPEVILGKAYNQKADVFSFAIVLWEIYTQEEPYEGRPGIDTAIEVAQSGLRPKIPRTCPRSFRSLMEKAWAHEPKERPSMEEILQRLLEMGKEAKAKLSPPNSPNPPSVISSGPTRLGST